MRTLPNSPILKAWLARDARYAELSQRETFSFEDEVFDKAAHVVGAHHPTLNQASIEIRAALQLLMAGHPGNIAEPEKELIVDSLEVRLPVWVRHWAIAVLVLLAVIAFAAIAKAKEHSMPDELLFNTGAATVKVSTANPLPVADAALSRPSATDLLQILINEVRALRRAFVMKAVADGGGITELDGDPEAINSELTNN